jgi:hypothetical protein
MKVESFSSAALAENLEQAIGRSKRKTLRERLWRYRWFALVVLLPTFLAAIYYGLIASDI